MPYYVKQEGLMFQIVERGSELVMQETKDSTFAKSRCRLLNQGSGFNGFTPPFFCAKYPNMIEAVSN